MSSVIKALLVVMLLCSGNPITTASQAQVSEKRPEQPTASQAYPQSVRLRFQHVAMDHGLPNPDVNRICQDSVGFMWFGTYSGLNRFDGREVKSIDIPAFDALCTDKKGSVWAGGPRGLYCIGNSKDTIVSYDLQGVRTIVADDDNTLWLGADRGLFHLDPETGRIVQIGREATRGIGVNSMAMDKRGNLWLVTKSSILCFNKASLRSHFISPRYEPITSSIAVGPDGMVWMANGIPYHLSCLDPRTLVMKDVRENGRQVSASAVAVDSSGTVYIGTAGQGLKIYDPATGYWQTYVHSKSDPQSLSNDIVNCVSLDRSGNLWIGTTVGVSWAARWRKGFTWISALTPDQRMRPAEVQDIVEDREGNLWLGTFGGLKKWDRKQPAVVSVTSAAHRIGCLCIGGRNKLWIAPAPGGGLLQLDTRGIKGSKVERLEWPGIKERVTAMYCDGDTMMWVGCVGCKLYRLDLRTRRKTTYHYETCEQLFQGYVPSAYRYEDCPRIIYRDRRGKLWIASFFGILTLDEHTGILKRYVHFNVREPSPRENTWCVYEDTRGRFWVGGDLGLDLFDRAEGTFRPIIHSSRRFTGKTVFGIVEDRKGALWLQTDGMLLKYTHDTGELKRYGPLDGFPLTDLGLFLVYGNRASCLTRSGEIAIGLRDGIVLFRPDVLWDNPGSPERVEITAVEVLGDSLHAGKRSISVFGLPSQPLRVEPDRSSIIFKFAGLDYTMPAQIRYAVWLEPSGHGWTDLGTQNSVRFLSLAPGKYHLRVKAANGNSTWGTTEASYRFEVLPPLWRTPYAYLFYFVVGIGLIYMTWRMQVRKIRMRHEYMMSRFEAEKLHEVDEMKARFFTNISHEFRTPLTLILGPVKQIAERAQDERTREELGMVHRNANKLLRLVNQLLDIAKLESGNMKLEAAPANVVRLVKAWVLSFSSHSDRKKIALNFSASEDEIIAYVDKDKMEKIVVNLLSNAFKFTPEGGRIDVTVGTSERCVNISVSDTGIGIRPDRFPRIFDRFYQVSGYHYGDQEGTGIGLSLTKELVELHKGKIEVESKEGQGASFTVSIPLGKEHLRAEDLCEPDDIPEERVRGFAEPEPGCKIEQDRLELEPTVRDGKPVVLVVEDNRDVRYYIKENLVDEYLVHEAVDGEDGWNKSAECMPDVIVSDVMMPKMDGFELCRKLKTDERTSHIPVILLTARATSQDKIEGFETGADDYMMKPFEPVELKARIRNLIVQRKRLHEHFSSKGIIELDDLKITSLDEKFLRKIFGLISENIANTSFNVEALAEMSAVSRSVLHRKIASLTGEPPVELIRRIRLRKAAELIEKKAGNISEIALEVGFTNPAYFSECFKKQFGVAPSQYHQS